MQIPDNNLNQSNPNNGPPAGPAFVRKRKTHLNNTMIAVLCSLPWATRLDQNNRLLLEINKELLDAVMTLHHYEGGLLLSHMEYTEPII